MCVLIYLTVIIPSWTQGTSESCFKTSLLPAYTWANDGKRYLMNIPYIPSAYVPKSILPST